MTASLFTPIRTFLFTGFGALLAVGWYHWSRWLEFLIVVVLLGTVFGIQAYAKSLISTEPVRAVGWINLRVVGIAVVSSVATAAAAIATIQFALPSSAADPNKTLVTTAVTGLTAFIAGIAITGDKVDSSIGDYTQKVFLAAFTETVKDAEGHQTVTSKFPRESLGEIALFTKYFAGWTDWSASNRLARAKAIQQQLQAN